MPNNLDLIWSRYDEHTPPKFYLLLYIGEYGNQTNALDANRVPDAEIAAMRANLEDLKKLDTTEVKKWLQKNTPVSYTHALRTFITSKLVFRNTYSLSTIGKSTKSNNR